jgi:hypothetical protein
MNLAPVHILLGALRVARPDDLASRRAIDRMCDLGLLQRASASIRVRPAPSEPLVTWQPGVPFPLTPGQVEYRLRKAWESAPVRRLTVVYATQKAANLYGGRGGEIRKPLQISHDLLTAAVFYRYRNIHEWVGEGVMVGDYRPDAALVGQGNIARVIEIGGLYPAERIRRMVLACHEAQIPMEIW